MKLSSLFYIGASTILSYISYVARFNTTEIDSNAILLFSAVATVLTALGAIISLLIQSRSGSVRDMQKIIDRLSADVEKLTAENVDLRGEIEKLKKLAASKKPAAKRKRKE